MAGKDFGVVGQMEQAFADALTKQFVIASCHISASDASAKEGVACKDPSLDFGIKADATLGVAWGADHLQRAPTHLDDFAVLQVKVGQIDIDLTFGPESQPHRVTFGLCEVRVHIGMCCHLDMITFLDCIVTKDVVDMTVRIDNHQWLEALAVDESEKSVFLVRCSTAWVDDNAFFGAVVVNDISVFSKGIEDERFEFEHGCFIEPALRQAQGPIKLKSLSLLKRRQYFRGQR